MKQEALEAEARKSVEAAAVILIGLIELEIAPLELILPLIPTLAPSLGKDPQKESQKVKERIEALKNITLALKSPYKKINQIEAGLDAFDDLIKDALEDVKERPDSASALHIKVKMYRKVKETLEAMINVVKHDDIANAASALVLAKEAEQKLKEAIAEAMKN